MESARKLLSSSGAPRMALAVCACLFVAEVASIVRHNLDANLYAPAPSIDRKSLHAKPAAARRTVDTRISAILDAHLFGAAPSGEVTESVGHSDLQISGLFAYDDPTAGFALLGKAGGSVMLVRTGEVTPDGALLREVYADHLVLEQGGRLVSQALVRQDSTSGGVWMPQATASNEYTSETSMRGTPYTPAGIPPGLTFASRLAMERDAHPPDLSQVPPPQPLPPDQIGQPVHP